MNALQESRRDLLPVFYERPHSRWIEHQVQQVARLFARGEVKERTEEPGGVSFVLITFQ